MRNLDGYTICNICYREISDCNCHSPYNNDIEISMIDSIDIKSMITILNDREQIMLKLRFGIDCSPHTYKEIANYFDLTKERIRQILTRVARILRSKYDRI